MLLQQHKPSLNLLCHAAMLQGQLPEGVAGAVLHWTTLLLEALRLLVCHAANLKKARESQKDKLAATRKAAAAHGTKSMGRHDKFLKSVLEYAAKLINDSAKC